MLDHHSIIFQNILIKVTNKNAKRNPNKKFENIGIDRISSDYKIALDTSVVRNKEKYRSNYIDNKENIPLYNATNSYSTRSKIFV